MSESERSPKRKNGPNKGEGGRPPKTIDWKTFDGLCQIHCTLEEICSILDVSDWTLNQACKKQFGETFLETYKKKSAMGKASLRRAMHQSAIGNPEKKIPPNPTMMIWLSKNKLGMTDKVETKVEADVKVEGEIKYVTTWGGMPDETN